MDDLGDPISYLVVSEGTLVYSSDDKPVGKVEHVLADSGVDVFDGIIIDHSKLPGGHRFVDAAQIDRIYERGVVLTIDAAAVENLPEPGANPAAMGVTREDFTEQETKLKRAWDRISGKDPSA